MGSDAPEPAPGVRTFSSGRRRRVSPCSEPPQGYARSRSRPATGRERTHAPKSAPAHARRGFTTSGAAVGAVSVPAPRCHRSGRLPQRGVCAGRGGSRYQRRADRGSAGAARAVTMAPSPRSRGRATSARRQSAAAWGAGLRSPLTSVGTWWAVPATVPDRPVRSASSAGWVSSRGPLCDVGRAGPLRCAVR